MLRSRSTKSAPARSATNRPTVDLPVAMKPLRKEVDASGRGISSFRKLTPPSAQGEFWQEGLRDERSFRRNNGMRDGSSRDRRRRQRAQVRVRSSRGRAEPRAFRRSGVVEVAVAAPPVDGAANDELVRILSSVLDIARRNVEIVGGAHGRTKLVLIRGVSGSS